MPDDAQATALFDRLAAIFAPYRSILIAKSDEPGNLSLETAPSPAYPGGLVLDAVKIGKRYVSFHLMQVYVHPDLLDGMTPEQRKRMQGTSCFNFMRPDDALFAELGTLTAAGFARLHLSASGHPSKRRKMVDAFWPPKPKPLTIAARTGIVRATCGT